MELKEAIEKLKVLSNQAHMKSYVCVDGTYVNTGIGKTEKEAIETVLQAQEVSERELKSAREFINEEEEAITERNNKICELEYKVENSISKDKIKEKIERLKMDLPYIVCSNKGCDKCFDKNGKPLYRGSEFIFCYAYHQIKVLQELLEKGEEMVNETRRKATWQELADRVDELQEKLSNSISKDKIKEKIKELKVKLEDVSKHREEAKVQEEQAVLWCLEIRLDERIKAYEELLKGE